MSSIKKTEIKTIQLNTALIIALVALLIGFFIGNIYDELNSGSRTVKTSSSQSGATQNQARMFALERQLENNPNDPQAWLELGNLYFDSDKPQEAIRAYDHYLSAQPDNPNVLTDLGVMYRRTGNPTQAIASFDKALKINPKHEQARYNKGVVFYYDVGFRDEAVKIWRELSEINPNFRLPDGRTITELVAQEK
jgi:tetratricopeptide (TPR) repeat protein